MTEHISASGVVICADELTAPSNGVTVIISLPPTPSESGACLVGRGRVTGPLTSSSLASPTFAVHVARYHLHRRASGRRRTH